MAKADLEKFRELMLTDAVFQEKLKKAAEAYNGDKDERAVFENVLTPLAEEYGLSASYEEFCDYAAHLVGESNGELSEDELSQVAGGKGNGSGVVVCALVGAGLGKMNKYDYCTILGAGIGICVAAGASVEP